MLNSHFEEAQPDAHTRRNESHGFRKVYSRSLKVVQTPAIRYSEMVIKSCMINSRAYIIRMNLKFVSALIQGGEMLMNVKSIDCSYEDERWTPPAEPALS